MDRQNRKYTSQKGFSRPDRHPKKGAQRGGDGGCDGGEGDGGGGEGSPNGLNGVKIGSQGSKSGPTRLLTHFKIKKV